MRPFLLQHAQDHRGQRPPGEHQDEHFTEQLAAVVIEDFSRPGDLVLDPFAGFGTTLVVAERLGRRAVGVELLPDRVEQVRARVSASVAVLCGDARRLGQLLAAGTEVDLCLTSPPYMSMVDHPENPLTAYRSTDGDYATYLAEMGQVFAEVAALLRTGGHAVLNVANVVSGEVVTPLAWDVAREVSRHLTFRGETFVCWDEHPPGLAGDYLLVFRRDEPVVSLTAG